VPLAASDPTILYTATSQIAFVLLGIWWLVVESRHEEWMRHTASRRGAYGVSVHFALPGVMSVMALAAVDHNTVWRVSFFVAGVIGAVEAARRFAAERQRPDRALAVTALAVIAVTYVLITLLALRTTFVEDLGIDLLPLEVEGILIGILLFAGVNLAWLAFSEPSAPDAPQA
jgi:hypothetical protein